MAHAARVSEIADNLVQSVLGVDKNDAIIAQTRNAVTRGLRDNSYGRTNQFEVKSRLDGLVEKFAVLNRDDLSEALQERLEELPTRSKWLPEILALFLSLSDRPVEKTAPDALEDLYAAEHPDEALTWEDIIADDPLDEPGIWDDIERGYHSSGDETRYDDEDAGSEPTTSTRATSTGDDNTEEVARLLVTEPDHGPLEAIKHSSRPFGETSPHVTDLLVVRESLCMLRGLPTDVYDLGAVAGTVQAKPNKSIIGVSRGVISDVLAQFASLGSTLQYVKLWARTTQSRPYVSTCQAIAEQWLAKLGTELSGLEQRYVGLSVNIVVSSTEVLSEARRITHHLRQLRAILARVLLLDTPFALLDELYDCVCTSQLAGDDAAFDHLSAMLFKATRTYLRPVAIWVSSGTIAEYHDDFFAAETGTTCKPGDLWHSKYTLRRSNDGALYTPRFMQDSVADMFAVGKAKMFLSQLTKASIEAEDVHCVVKVPEFDSMRQQLEDCPLLPFADAFNETLQDWVKSISTDVTPGLKVSLLKDHGLLRMLTAMDSIYLSADGALFKSLAESLFDRIRRTKSSWSNNFLLTELVRETLGEGPYVDSASLFVDTRLDPKIMNITQALQAINITYHIPWPLQNITRESSPHAHAKAFALLMQVSYAYHVLQSRTFDLRAQHSTTDQPIHNITLHLRHTFIVFTTMLRTHIATVASVLSTDLRTSLSEAADIDAMVTVYAAHKRRLESVLLLSANLDPIREAMVSGLVLCEQFGSVWDAALEMRSDPSSQLRVGSSLRRLQKEFRSTVGFVAAGVRNVSRVGGEALLAALAEQLDLVVAR